MTMQLAIPVTVHHQMLSASSTSFSFGNQPMGTSSTPKQLTLTDTATGNVAIQVVNASGDFSETDNCIASSPLTPGNGCTVNVTFSPTTSGTRVGTLSITNSANTVPIAVFLNGTGTTTPYITSVSPTSGSVGISVNITGVNFGATQATSTVTFNGAAATPTSWSATSIAVTVPAGATTGNVVVTVGGVASNGMTFTVTSTSGNIVYVQHASTDAGTTTSATLAFNSNNTVGNLIAVVIRAGSSSSQVLNVEDSNGNTYRQAFQLGITANPITFAIFYAENIKGGANTIEVSDTVSGPLRFAILEYSGVATANSLDVTATAQGTSTSPNSGNATTTASGDWLVGEVVTNNTATFTAGTSYTTKEFVPAEPSTKLIAEDQIQTTAGAASASASLAASDNWGAGLAAFKAVGRAGPLVQHTATDSCTTTTSSLTFVSPNTAGNLIAA